MNYIYLIGLLISLVMVLVIILVYRRNVVHSYKKQIKERFPQLSDSDEAAERMAVLNHISKDDIVLEIGANIGGVSTLLASILSHSKNLVSIDPHKGNCRFLKKEGKRLGKPFHVFHGVVKGPTLLSCTGSNKVGSYVHCEPCQSNSLTENLSISEIEQRYGLQFTAIVIDCEGCYESLMPQILKHKTIRQIQIEWDGKFIEDDILKAGYKHVDTYTHLYLYKGVRVYKKPSKKAVKNIEKF